MLPQRRPEDRSTVGGGTHVQVDLGRYEALVVERDGPVLRVWFDRPDQLNAINPAVHGELETIFSDIDRDDATSVAVLGGRGRAFSAGGDLDWLVALNQDPAASYRSIQADRRIQRSLLHLEKPLLARVQGPAVGLGCSIALYADFVIATPEAIFADPHVSVGLVAGDGGALLWPQLIGFMRARRYLLTGEQITGAVAAELGLITDTAPADELDAVVDSWVDKLLRQPQEALRWTKVSINAGLLTVAAAVLDTSAGYENVTQLSAAHAEKLAAMRRKTSG
jgi:enoyl-CoA hydratase/carnithine racemase